LEKKGYLPQILPLPLGAARTKKGEETLSKSFLPFPPQILPLPLGGGGLRWGREFFPNPPPPSGRGRI